FTEPRAAPEFQEAVSQGRHLAQRLKHGAREGCFMHVGIQLLSHVLQDKPECLYGRLRQLAATHAAPPAAPPAPAPRAVRSPHRAAGNTAATSRCSSSRLPPASP